MLLSTVASGAARLLRRGKAKQPFDCYTGDGHDYVGLVNMGESGRTCQNWLENGKFDASLKVIGNHNYCRNPRKKESKPWCFVVDPSKGKDYKEFCNVPKCPEDGGEKEPWVSPKGSKSPGLKPCEYEPPKTPTYEFFYDSEDRACMDERGDKKWLVGERVEAADEKECKGHCDSLSGADYFTYFADKDAITVEGKNCGCYKLCVFVAKDLTVGRPNSYKILTHARV